MKHDEMSETYYEILKVDRKATVAEIVNAYHTAKTAFSRDSVATYSLFSPEEIQVELKKLEQAYVTLSNLEKRAQYDRSISVETGEVEMMAVGQSLSRRTEAPAPRPLSLVSPVAETTAPATPFTPSGAEPPPTEVTELTGATLKENREKRGLSVEDVARITKIPSKFVVAMENEEVSRLPARVYIQGFIKNLAVLYRLEPKSAAKAFIAGMDSRLPKVE